MYILFLYLCFCGFHFFSEKHHFFGSFHRVWLFILSSSVVLTLEKPETLNDFVVFMLAVIFGLELWIARIPKCIRIPSGHLVSLMAVMA